jgi:thiamine-phosphate pyrophosphorylase
VAPSESPESGWGSAGTQHGDLAGAPEVIAAGATRLAVIRAITRATDPEHAAHTLRTLLPD